MGFGGAAPGHEASRERRPRSPVPAHGRAGRRRVGDGRDQPPAPGRRDRRPTRRPTAAGARRRRAGTGRRRRVARRGAGPPPAAPRRGPRAATRDQAQRRSPSRRATRARRTIRTTRPLLVNRFGAGRPRPRLIWTLIVLVLVLGGVLAKVGLMQGMGGEALRAQAAELWTRSRQLPAQRGTIFDRNGDELALSVPGSTIAVNPRQVLDAAGTIDTLGDLLDLSDERRAELLTEMPTCDCGFLYVARQADPRIGRQISSLGLVGVTRVRRGPPDDAGGQHRSQRHRAHRHRRHRHRRARAAVPRPAAGQPGRDDARGRPRRAWRSPGPSTCCSRRRRGPTSSRRSTARCSTRPSRCSSARSVSPGLSAARSSSWTPTPATSSRWSRSTATSRASRWSAAATSPPSAPTNPARSAR